MNGTGGQLPPYFPLYVWLLGFTMQIWKKRAHCAAGQFVCQAEKGN